MITMDDNLLLKWIELVSTIIKELDAPQEIWPDGRQNSRYYDGLITDLQNLVAEIKESITEDF